MIIAATGHRPDKLLGDYSLKFKDYGPFKKEIYTKLEKIVLEKQATGIISGVSQGVDMIFANIVTRVRIALILAIPFEGQEKTWPKEAQDHYNWLLSIATRVVIVSKGGYTKGKYQKRNRWMVDNSDMLIAVWNNIPHGGTYNCIEYAKNVNKPIEYINI